MFSDYVSENLDGMADYLGFKSEFERIFGAVMVGSALGAAINDASLESGLMAGGTGLGMFYAFKLSKAVVKSVINNETSVARLASHLGDDVKRAFGELMKSLREDDLKATAVQKNEGVWMVREPGEVRFKKMAEDEFRAFESSLANRALGLVKVSISDDGLTVSRFNAGRLHGDHPAFPAFEVMRPDRTREIRYAAHGKMLDGPNPDFSIGYAR